MKSLMKSAASRGAAFRLRSDTPTNEARSVNAAPLTKVSRRDFLRIVPTATAGLVIGIHLPRIAQASPLFKPNAYLCIDQMGIVTVIVARSEMGQGVRTSIPMLVAEELEADWNKVRIEPALANKDLYGDQGTGGSDSIQSLFTPLRQAGAAAREMLIEAAAKGWNVPASECRARNGMVEHPPSGKRLGFAGCVEEAAKLPVPKEPKLKDPKEFRILGTPIKRLDTPSKTDGTAIYGIDVRVPGMMFAMVARPPVPGAKLQKFDEPAAHKIAGVKHVVRFGESVAVVADNSWSARQGRDAMNVAWDDGPNAALSSASIEELFKQTSEKGGVAWRKDGDVEKALQSSKMLNTVYHFPFLAHAPMEPQNCTAHVHADSAELWAPTQVPQDVQEAVAGAIGLKPEQIKVHITLMGGGFGRRLFADYAVEAAQVSKAVGAPVQVLWTREDDTQGHYYRPASYHRMSGGVDANGWPLAYRHQVVSPSIAHHHWSSYKDGLDNVVVGQTMWLYETPNVHLEYAMANTPITPAWWRAVYTTHCGFATECFVDELAKLGGKDPYAWRLKLLEGNRTMKVRRTEWSTARLRNVLELAATKAGWGKPLPKGRARGIACYPSFGSYAAHVAEVSIQDGAVRVHRVTCAVDCGMHVNPDIIAAQMESSVVFGLTAVLHDAITIEKGRVQQSNFHDYPMLRIHEMPVVETHIVKNTERPGGIGEPGVAVVAPAVANAVFALTGKPVRRLPIRAEDLA